MMYTESKFKVIERFLLSYNDILIEEGRKRMRLGGQGVKNSTPFNRLKRIGDSANASHTTVSRVQYILKSGNEKIINSARAGEISIVQAYYDLKGIKPMKVNTNKGLLYESIKKVSNQSLRELIVELRTISKQNQPANYKQSPLLKALFLIEKTKYWSDKFINIETYVKLEIIDRFIEI